MNITCPARPRQKAFSLIELLVVVAIIGLLAALILPALGRAKREGKKVVCLNHFRQFAGFASMYEGDHDDIVPNPVGGKPIRPDLWCADDVSRLKEAANRPFNQYVKDKNVFVCPEDKGIDMRPNGVSHLPTQFDAMGNSYLANPGGWSNTRHENLGGPVGKHLGWITSPTKYILIVEPPALPHLKQYDPCQPPACEYFYIRWHMANPAYTQARAAVDGQAFFSPVLYVDGHAAFQNFRAALMNDRTFPTEETKDWIWYKAGDGPGDTADCP